MKVVHCTLHGGVGSAGLEGRKVLAAVKGFFASEKRFDGRGLLRNLNRCRADV
jgi:hypothetical protein